MSNGELLCDKPNDLAVLTCRRPNKKLLVVVDPVRALPIIPITIKTDI